MSITKDFLPNHPDVVVYQDDEMFRINTDTKILGEFLKLKHDDTILDIGTNNGALLLYASFQKPKEMIGIDINSKALLLAKKNMEANNITNYQLTEADANSYSAERVDVIVCNPPYFKTRQEDRGDNPYLSLAKHENNLQLESLVQTIAKNLKTHGRLFMLFQTARMFELFDLLVKYHLYPERIKFAYDNNKEQSHIFVVKAIRDAKRQVIVEKPVITIR